MDVTETKPAAERSDESAERGRRHRLRSLAIAAALVLLVVLFYVATIVRLGGNVMKRAI
jgi:hypothetical protein